MLRGGGRWQSVDGPLKAAESMVCTATSVFHRELHHIQHRSTGSKAVQHERPHPPKLGHPESLSVKSYCTAIIDEVDV